MLVEFEVREMLIAFESSQSLLPKSLGTVRLWRPGAPSYLLAVNAMDWLGALGNLDGGFVPHEVCSIWHMKPPPSVTQYTELGEHAAMGDEHLDQNGHPDAGDELALFLHESGCDVVFIRPKRFKIASALVDLDLSSATCSGTPGEPPRPVPVPAIASGVESEGGEDFAGTQSFGLQETSLRGSGGPGIPGRNSQDCRCGVSLAQSVVVLV